MAHFEIETQICKVSLHYFSFFHQRRRRCGKAIGMIIGCGSRWSISSLKFTFFQPHPAQYFSTRWKQTTYAAPCALRITSSTRTRLWKTMQRCCVGASPGAGRPHLGMSCGPRSHNAYCVKRTLYQICFVHTHSPILAATHTLYWCIPLVHNTGAHHWYIPLVCHTSLQHFKRASHVLQTGIIPRRPQPGQNCP